MAYRNKTYISAKRFIDTTKRIIDVEITYGVVRGAKLLNVGVIV